MDDVELDDTHALAAQTNFVRELARRLTRDEHAAEDIAQDAWLIALRKRDAVRGPMRAWLVGVVGNLVVDRRRSRLRRDRRERAVARPEAEAPFDSAMLADETRARVKLVIAELAPAYRDVLVLRYYEDLSPAEIAQQLALPLETVRTRLKRGLAQLRQKLAREGRDESTLRGLVWLLVGESWRTRRPAWRAAASLALVVIAGALIVWARQRRTEAAPAEEAAAPSHEAALEGARARSVQEPESRTASAEPVIDEPGGLVRTRSLAGTVVDTAGRPVAGARVSWRRNRRDVAASEVASTASATDGTFELLDVDSDFVADASDGARRARLNLIGARATRGRLAGLVFVLETPRALSGTVVDARGAPVEGAQVQVGARAADGVEFPTAFRGVKWGRAQMLSATTDRRGRFQIEGLLGGLLRLTASHPDFARAALAVSAGTTEVEVVMREGVAPRWRIVDERGGPIEGARVRMKRAAVEREATSDAHGEFVRERLDVGERLDLAIEASGFASEVLQSVAVESDGVRDFVLSAPRSLRGVVLDRAGRPLGGANLIARRPLLDVARADLRLALLPPALESVRSDAQGRFEFARVPPGPLTIDVWLQRGSEATETFAIAPGEQAVELEIGAADARRPKLTIAVRDAGSGTALGSFTVSATPRADTLRFGTRVLRVESVDATPWHALEPGSWWLHVEAPGHAPLVRELELAPSAAETLELELERTTSLALSVVDAAGAPLAFASVALRRASGERVLTDLGGDRSSDEVVLDHLGRARFEALPAAKLTLEIRTAWSASASRIELDLGRDEVRESVVVLEGLHRSDMTRSLVLDGLEDLEGRALGLRVRDASGASRLDFVGRIVDGELEPAEQRDVLLVMRRTIDLAAAHPADTWLEQRGSAWHAPDGSTVFSAAWRAIPLPAGRASVELELEGCPGRIDSLEPGASDVVLHLSCASAGDRGSR